MNIHHNQDVAFSGRNLQIGETIALSGINWTEHHLTLVMVMQVGCHWCEESASFYRVLSTRESMGRKFHVVAVLPQPLKESQNFLRTLNISIQDIRQQEFQQLGVYATPTLILVDGTGRIKAIWVGKLAPDSEKEVFEDLGIGDIPGQA
jgi:thioredoxin-related protein